MTNSNDAELIREPGKFQPGRLSDLLFMFQITTSRLIEIGSDHVRTGITNPGEVDEMAKIMKEALEMWLGLSPCNDGKKILDHLRQKLSSGNEDLHLGWIRHAKECAAYEKERADKAEAFIASKNLSRDYERHT